MAHPRIIAQRQAIAVERLMASASKLAKRHGLQEQIKLLENAKSRDAGMTQMLQTEALAGLLDALDKSTKAVKADTEALHDEATIEEAKAETDAPLTVETVDEQPLETTETVEIVDDSTPKKGARHAK